MSTAGVRTFAIVKPHLMVRLQALLLLTCRAALLVHKLACVNAPLMGEVCLQYTPWCGNSTERFYFPLKWIVMGFTSDS